MRKARTTRRAARSAVLVLLLACATVTALQLGRGAAAHVAPARAPANARVAVVIAGEYCPVAQAEHPCPVRPIGGVEVALLQHGDIVAVGRADGRGAVVLSALPGPAVIRAHSASGAYVFRTSRTVTLDAASTTRIQLLLDTGIR